MSLFYIQKKFKTVVLLDLYSQKECPEALQKFQTAVLY